MARKKEVKEEIKEEITDNEEYVAEDNKFALAAKRAAAKKSDDVSESVSESDIDEALEVASKASASAEIAAEGANKASESAREATEAANKAIEAVNKAISNTSSTTKMELVMPKKMKMRMSNPVITFCVLLITLVIVASAIGLCIGGYYVVSYGLDYLDGSKVDLSEYDAMVQDYEGVIDSYAAKILEYETTLNAYTDAIMEYEDLLNDYQIVIDTQSEDVNAIIDELSNISDSLSANAVNAEATATTLAFDDGDFVIYYPTRYAYDIEDIIECSGLSDNEAIKLVQYDSLTTDKEEILENADLILYESGKYEFEAADLLASNNVGLFYYDLVNMYPLGNTIATSTTGAVNQFPYVLSPGFFYVKEDLADKYFDTDDADEIFKEYFKDMSTIAETCEYIYEESNGKVYLFASREEVMAIYNSGLVDKDIDYDEFCELTEDYLPECDLYDSDWQSYLNGDEKEEIMAVFGCTYTKESFLEDAGFGDENALLIKAPVYMTVGAEVAAVPTGCSDVITASAIIKTLLSNEDMMAILNDNGDFVNNRVFVNGDDFESDLDDIIYDEQDYMEFITSILEMK